MTSIHAASDAAKGTTRARIHASTQTGSAPLDARITVTRDQGRLAVSIERRRARMFYLSDDEAAYLAELLRLALPPVTVRKVGEE